MLVYIIIFLYLTFLVVYYDINCQNSRKKANEILSVVVLVLLAGLRYQIGSDTLVYEDRFYMSSDLNTFFTDDWLLGREPLWALLNSAVLTWFKDFTYLQLLVAIPTNILLFKFFKKTTRKYFTALLITFVVIWWNYNFEIMREAFVASIYLNTLFLLKRKKYIIYVLASLPLLLLHRFAFVVIFLTPIFVLFKGKWLYTALAVITIWVFVFVDLSELNTILIFMSGNMNEELSDKMMSYAMSEGEGFHDMSFSLIGIIELVLLKIVLPILVIYSIRKEKEADSFLSFYQSMVFLFILFSFISLKLSIIGRFNNYIYPIFIVGIINLLYSKRIKTPVRLLALVLTCMLMIDGAYNFYRPTYNQKGKSYNTLHIPYKSVLNKKTYENIIY